VGVNEFVAIEETATPIMQLDPRGEADQRARLAALKASRDPSVVDRCLGALGAAARSGANLMPVIVDAVRAHVTLGEVADVLRTEFGEYREQAGF